MQQFLTRKDIADALRVHRSTLTRWANHNPHLSMLPPNQGTRQKPLYCERDFRDQNQATAALMAKGGLKGPRATWADTEKWRATVDQKKLEPSTSAVTIANSVAATQNGITDPDDPSEIELELRIMTEAERDLFQQLLSQHEGLAKHFKGLFGFTTYTEYLQWVQTFLIKSILSLATEIPDVCARQRHIQEFLSATIKCVPSERL